VPKPTEDSPCWLEDSKLLRAQELRLLAATNYASGNDRRYEFNVILNWQAALKA